MRRGHDRSQGLPLGFGFAVPLPGPLPLWREREIGRVGFVAPPGPESGRVAV